MSARRRAPGVRRVLAFVAFAALFALVSLIVVASPRSAHAEGWSAFPTLSPNSAVALGSGVEPRPYEALDTCLAHLGDSTRARFFAAVVDVTDATGRKDPSANDAVPYVDALYQSLRGTGRLEPETHVLIVLGMKNHAVAVHPGTRWADLGFVKSVVSATIDGSGFKVAARAGEPGKAICALAQAIDAKIFQLQRDADQRRVITIGKVIEGRGRLAVLRKQVAGFDPRYAKLAATISAELTRAEQSLDLAEHQVPQGQVAAATSSMLNATSILSRYEERLTDLKATMDGLPARRAALAADITSVKVDTSPTFAPTIVAVDQLTQCDSRAARTEQGLVSGADEVHGLEGVDSCRDSALHLARSARDSWSLATRTLPVGVAVLLGLIALALALSRRRARGLLLAEVEAELARWSTQLENASARLLELEQGHPIYFAAGAVPWTGESQAIDQASADAVNRAFLFYDEASSLVRRSRALVKGAGPLSLGPLREARALLGSKRVVFETGDRERRRRIFLPLTERWEGAAAQLLGELERSYDVALDRLDRRMTLVNDVERERSELAEVAQIAVTLVKAREELGLPSTHLMARLAPALELQRQATASAVVDPVGALAAAKNARLGVSEVRRRAQLGNDVAGRMRGPLAARLGGLGATVTRLAAEGFSLDEERLVPKARHDRLCRRLDEAWALLAAGKEPEAEAVVNAAAADVDRLAADLAETERARREVPEELTGLAESDNLDELSALLREIAARRLRVEADLQAQRYLAAAAGSKSLADLVAAGDALLRAIDAIETTLGEARNQARAAEARANALASRVEAWLESHRAGVGDALRARASAARETLAPIAEAAAAPTPHWPRVVEAWAKAERDLEGLLQTLAAEDEALRNARMVAKKLERTVARLTREVETETRDRPHVAAAVKRVAEQLGVWSTQFEDPRLSGSECLRHAASAERAIAQVEDLWAAEQTLIRQIESQLQAGRAEASSLASRHFGYGITGPSGVGAAELEQAQVAFQGHDLDQALWLTVEARRLVSVEASRCQAAANQAAAVEAAALAAQLAAAEARRQSEASSWSSSSSSSSSSWSSSSSDSSSSSWSSSSSSDSSSSSGGSSWGDSNSGGSSW